MLGVNLHVINVSRISPLELEGVQMPTDGQKLELLLATYWNSLKDGDIVLLDEFLRGFPEVYNGLLDILTSRVVAGHALPDVFFVAASNSTTAYDSALTDRLMHLHVPDPRKSKSEDERIRKTILNALGLLPELTESMEMDTVMQAHVHPMYRMLDQAAGANIGGSSRGADMSPRNLIGQAKLRLVQSSAMFALLEANNSRAMQQGKPQYVRVVHTDHSFSTVDPTYVAKIKPILASKKLTDDQVKQAIVNISLIEANEVMKEANNDPFSS